MSNHISDELPRLLTGDATRDVVLAAAEHLRFCPDCQQELVSAVIAHASLTSAHRFAPEVVAPDASTFERSATEVAGPLPDMNGIFEQVREEAAANARHAAPVGRLPRRRLLAVAAAAVVLVGGGGAVAAELASGNSSSPQNVALSAYDDGKNPASATINGTKLTVDATSLPRLDSMHRYEVWLTDRQRQKMQPIGYIGDNKTVSVTVPADVISQYTDIEVSVQQLNQNKYSGTSVLRGDYG